MDNPAQDSISQLPGPGEIGTPSADRPESSVVSPPLELGTPKQLVRIDLACGQNPREGFEGVDLLAPGARRVDLFKFPWPWADSSVDELHCSHFVEHIPARNVEGRDLNEQLPYLVDRFVGVDMLIAFFDEAWRILRPEGKFRVIVPALQSVRAFQDPTHRRFIPAETFLYLSRDWLRMQRLDHYRTRCNFTVNANPTIPTELSLLSPEAQGRRMREGWNVMVDWIADLVAIKPGA